VAAIIAFLIELSLLFAPPRKVREPLLVPWNRAAAALNIPLQRRGSGGIDKI
jgi:hypothetical protein